MSKQFDPTSLKDAPILKQATQKPWVEVPVFVIDTSEKKQFRRLSIPKIVIEEESIVDRFRKSRESKGISK